MARGATPSLSEHTSPCAAGPVWNWDPCLTLSSVAQVLGTESQVGDSAPRSQSGRGARIPRHPRPQQTGECLPPAPMPWAQHAGSFATERAGAASLPRWRPAGLAKGRLRGSRGVALGSDPETRGPSGPCLNSAPVGPRMRNGPEHAAPGRGTRTRRWHPFPSLPRQAQEVGAWIPFSQEAG